MSKYRIHSGRMDIFCYIILQEDRKSMMKWRKAINVFLHKDEGSKNEGYLQLQ